MKKKAIYFKVSIDNNIDFKPFDLRFLVVIEFNSHLYNINIFFDNLTYIHRYTPITYNILRKYYKKNNLTHSLLILSI